MHRLIKFQRHFPLARLFTTKTIMQPPTEPRILFTNTPNNQLSEVTLNNPKALNAFDFHMSTALLTEVDNWHKNNTKIVIFKGAGGKAFCAGGDVKILYMIKKGLVEDPLIAEPAEYFRSGYTLNYKLATMKPLQIALWDGFVMGGGVGISIHAPITIATEKTVFAMPEAKIGFFTDVAGGWFLSKLRGNIGLYLGLTSAQLRGEDVVKAGIAKYFVESKDLEKLQQDLRNLVSGEDNLSKEELEKNVYTIIENYSKPVSGTIPNEMLIKSIFSRGSFEEIYQALELDTENKEFTLKTLKQLDGNSPLSLKVIFEQISRHQNITLKDAFKSDYRTAWKFMEGVDFFEGVRCLLVDKGDKPNWEFDQFSKISEEEVAKYFMELPVDKELALD